MPPDERTDELGALPADLKTTNQSEILWRSFVHGSGAVGPFDILLNSSHLAARWLSKRIGVLLDGSHRHCHNP